MACFARTVVPSCVRFVLRLALIVPVAAGTLAVAASGAVAQEGQPEVEFHPPEGADTTDLPFSEVVRVGSTLYLSGQLGVNGLALDARVEIECVAVMEAPA